MNGHIKILHIDPDYRINYFIFRPRLSIRTVVPLSTAIELLKTVDFDLILSEPHDKAILKGKQHSLKSRSTRRVKPMETDHGGLKKVRSNRFL
jgi:hypothetical protein